MSEEPSSQSGRRSWLEKLADAFSSELRDKEQVMELLQEAHENELLDHSALHIMQGAMNVTDQHARDIMVPRSQMICIEHGDSFASIMEKIVTSSHSRFPVLSEDSATVTGVLLAKDILQLAQEYAFDVEKIAANLHKIIRQPVFVPEIKRLNRLLRDFRETRNHMAVVVDEYGGVAGLVTIEDVLEEIVGDIEDEHDPAEEEDIQEMGGGLFRVAALTEIEDFNEHFNTALSDEEFDTIGGFVTHVFGYLPKKGESVRIADLLFTVHSADDRRILHLQVMPVGSAAVAESEPDTTPTP
ncbi:MAG: CBS domain-containing protein [Natronospirillum sp.]